MGNADNFTNKQRRLNGKERTLRSLNNEANQRAIGLIQSMNEQGKTFEEIAAELNKRKFKTSRNNPFIASTVYILAKRFKQAV